MPLAPVLWLLLLTTGPLPAAAGADGRPIGRFTAVEGNVYAARPGADRPVVVEEYAPLVTDDALETQPRSRAKVLLEDDTLIAVGEDSRLQVLEHDYQPQQDRRTLVLKLWHGRVRILVGRRFTAPGSRVELQTPVAVVSAGDGAFAAWVEAGTTGMEGAGRTGVTNIGRSPVTFTSAGRIVTLIGGQSTTALLHRPPSPPELVRTAVSATNRTVADTQLREQPVRESPHQILVASGGVPVESAPGAPGRLALQQAALQVPGSEPPMIPLTPPAVISGAAPVDGAAAPPPPTSPMPPPRPAAPVPAAPTPSPAPVPHVSPASPSVDLAISIPSVSAPPVSVRLESGKGGPKKGQGQGRLGPQAHEPAHGP